MCSLEAGNNLQATSYYFLQGREVLICSCRGGVEEMFYVKKKCSCLVPVFLHSSNVRINASDSQMSFSDEKRRWFGFVFRFLCLSVCV